MNDVRRPRARILWVFAAAIAGVAATFGGCTDYSRGPGETCLSDDECLSGVCLQQVCGSPSPVLNGSAYPDGSGEAGTGPDPDAGMSVIDSGSDSTLPTPDGSSMDAGAEASIDAGHDSDPSKIDAGDDGAQIFDSGDAQNATDSSDALLEPDPSGTMAVLDSLSRFA